MSSVLWNPIIPIAISGPNSQWHLLRSAPSYTRQPPLSLYVVLAPLSLVHHQCFPWGIVFWWIFQSYIHIYLNICTSLTLFISESCLPRVLLGGSSPSFPKEYLWGLSQILLHHLTKIIMLLSDNLGLEPRQAVWYKTHAPYHYSVISEKSTQFLAFHSEVK